MFCDLFDESFFVFVCFCEKRMMTLRIILHAVNINGFIYINFTACNIVVRESSPYNLKSNNLMFLTIVFSSGSRT